MPFTTRSTSTPGNPGEPVDYRRRLLVVPAMMTMFIAGAVDAAPNPTGSPSASVAGKADAWPYSATAPAMNMVIMAGTTNSLRR